MKACYIFPGQGQTIEPGVGKSFYDKYKSTRDIFNKGKDILEYDIIDLMFNGPKEELNKTINAQPVILLNNLAHFELLKQKHKCVLTLGNSAGKSSALYSAGCFDLETAIRFTQKRGKFMSESIEELVDEKTKQNLSHMAVIRTEDLDLVSKVCDKYSISYSNKGVVEISNINPGQIVVSGNKLAVGKVINYFKNETKIRTIPLPVEGPFHSQLMKSAENKIRELLENQNQESENYIKINPPNPETPFIANSTGEIVNYKFTSKQIRELLINQICGTVQWKKSLETAISNGCRTFIESGLGKVHSKMLRKNYKGIKILDLPQFCFQ